MMTPHAFWQQFIPLAVEAGALPPGRQPHHSQRYLNFRADRPGWWWGYHRRPNGVRVNLHISTPNAGENHRMLRDLQLHREAVEREFGDRLEWYPNPTGGAIIAYDIQRGGTYSQDSDWRSVHLELIEAMRRFQSALAPYLRTLR